MRTRIQFVAYRTMGEPEKADLVHQECGNRHGLFTQPEGLSESDLPAWLKFHQSELEILREKGKNRRSAVTRQSDDCHLNETTNKTAKYSICRTPCSQVNLALGKSTLS